MIKNQNIFDTYEDLYLIEKERVAKMLESIQSKNGLEAWSGAKKADGTTITVTTKDSTIKKAFGKRFVIPMDFNFFKHPINPHGLREDLIIMLELNSSEKVLL